MKILHVFAIIIMVLSFSACGGSVDSSSAELGSGGEAGVSEVSIGELGGLSGSQFDVTFPKAVAAGSITAENFFAVKVSALPEDSVAAASEVVLFDDSSLCSPAAALAASRSMSPDGYRVRMVLSQPVDLPDRILFCLGVISYMDGTSSAPLQQYVGRAQDGAAPKVVGIVLQGAGNGQLAYAAGRQMSVATGVPIDVAVKVFFSKPLKVSSVNRSTVMLADPKGVRILAALSYDEEWMMASLDPAKDLEAGATYSVKVSPNEAGCNPLRDGLCKVVRDSIGAPMLTSLTKPFTTAGASWPPCDADGKGALPSCEVFFGAFDKEALKCVPYEGADPSQAPNGGVGYSYDGVTLMGFFSKDPDPAAALACFVSQASSAQHRAEILAGCVPLDHVLSSFGTCEMPKLGLSSGSVELSCTAGGSCNTGQVIVTNDGGRTLVWQASSCDDRGTNLCQKITRNPSSGSLASGASSAMTIGASGLPKGRHGATITVASNAAKEMTISVSMNVTPGGGGDVECEGDNVSIVPVGGLTYTCVEGGQCGSPQPQGLSITNDCGVPINWSVLCQDQSAWDGVDICLFLPDLPLQGSLSAYSSEAGIDLGAVSALAAGTYQYMGNLQVTISAEGQTIKVAPVSFAFVVEQGGAGVPALSVSSIELPFSCIAGDSCDANTLTISNSGSGGTLNWEINKACEPTDPGNSVQICENMASFITVAASGSGDSDVGVQIALPPGASAGTYTGRLIVTATDALGQAAPGSPQLIMLTITVTTPVGNNTPPQPTADSYMTNSEDALIVNAPGLLGNDKDTEMDALCTFPHNGPTTYGVVSFASNGSFTYTPQSVEEFTDEFSYVVCDRADLCASLSYEFDHCATSFVIITHDKTPPTASIVSPVSGASDVALDATVLVSFSEAMGEATINSSTFILIEVDAEGHPAGDPLDGTVSCTSDLFDCDGASLDPMSSLKPLTTYMVFLNDGKTDGAPPEAMTDQAGNAIAQPYMWTFTTMADWVSVGDDGAVSEGGVDQIALAVDAGGVPYVAYADATVSNQPTVKRYMNGAWETLGSPGIYAGTMSLPTLTIDSHNRVYLAFTANYSGPGTGVVMRYDGAAWEMLFEDAIWSKLYFVLGSRGTPYVQYYSQSSVIDVKKYEDGSWVSLERPQNNFNNYGQAFTISPNDKLYAASAKKFAWPFVETILSNDGVMGWVELGDSADLESYTSGNSDSLKLLADSSETVYLAYRDSADNYFKLIEYSDADGWTAPATIGYYTNWISVVFGPDGGLYAALGGKVQSLKDGVWEAIGSIQSILDNSVSALAIDPSGNMYLAYVKQQWPVPEAAVVTFPASK